MGHGHARSKTIVNFIQTFAFRVMSNPFRVGNQSVCFRACLGFQYIVAFRNSLTFLAFSVRHLGGGRIIHGGSTVSSLWGNGVKLQQS